MSLHIEADAGQIARTVLITGDPLRAKHHAEKFLLNPFCYNHIRGMLGYTGKYNDHDVSIQGTGIGIPSTALYMYELIHTYGVMCIIRVGTCGAIQKNIQLGQIILATAAITDSNTTLHYFKDPDFKPAPDPQLLQEAKDAARKVNVSILDGKVFSTDLFYSDQTHRWDDSAQQGVLAVDMETSMVYTMAAKYDIRCLSILTVSDNILTGEAAPAKDRELETGDMVKLALEIVPKSGI